MRLLILGGTAEASALARRWPASRHRARCCRWPGAPRSRALADPAAHRRLRRRRRACATISSAERIDAVIDATHPFAAQMSRQRRRRLRAPRDAARRLHPPALDARAGDRWIEVDDHARTRSRRSGAAPRACSSRKGGCSSPPSRARRSIAISCARSTGRRRSTRCPTQARSSRAARSRSPTRRADARRERSKCWSPRTAAAGDLRQDRGGARARRAGRHGAPADARRAPKTSRRSTTRWPGSTLIAPPRRLRGVSSQAGAPSRAMNRVSLEPISTSVLMSARPGRPRRAWSARAARRPDRWRARTRPASSPRLQVAQQIERLVDARRPRLARRDCRAR